MASLALCRLSTVVGPELGEKVIRVQLRVRTVISGARTWQA